MINGNENEIRVQKCIEISFSFPLTVLQSHNQTIAKYSTSGMHGSNYMVRSRFNGHLQIAKGRYQTLCYVGT